MITEKLTLKRYIGTSMPDLQCETITNYTL